MADLPMAGVIVASAMRALPHENKTCLTALSKREEASLGTKVLKVKIWFSLCSKENVLLYF